MNGHRTAFTAYTHCQKFPKNLLLQRLEKALYSIIEKRVKPGGKYRVYEL